MTRFCKPGARTGRPTLLLEPAVTLKAWTKKVGTGLRDRRVEYRRHTLKLMDAVDASASSLARAYAEHSAAPFWVPELPPAA